MSAVSHRQQWGYECFTSPHRYSRPRSSSDLMISVDEPLASIPASPRTGPGNLPSSSVRSTMGTPSLSAMAWSVVPWAGDTGITPVPSPSGTSSECTILCGKEASDPV